MTGFGAMLGTEVRVPIHPLTTGLARGDLVVLETHPNNLGMEIGARGLGARIHVHAGLLHAGTVAPRLSRSEADSPAGVTLPP
jgi:hypothetical protein